MDGSNDVRDILELSGGDSLRNIMDSGKKTKKSKKTEIKKPEGMARELWGLLWTDNMDAPPLIPTETPTGYKALKAKLGSSKVRPWSWMPFQNPARKDGAIFYHWRRKADEGKPYPFSDFNKKLDIPKYTDNEYNQTLTSSDWSRQETDHLMELALRFDLRFIIMADKWAAVVEERKFKTRDVEELKDRYYFIVNTLSRGAARGKAFDAEHERKRKKQLINLYNRTEELVDEEQSLIQELKKIDSKKREREKKTADLQKLISAADTNEHRKLEKKSSLAASAHIPKKKIGVVSRKDSTVIANPETSNIKFTDSKTAGVTLRSQRLKLPNSVGLKRTKAIEQVLEELGIDLNPIPTDEIVNDFNELRQDIVLLYDLKQAQANCDYEIQTLKLSLQTLAPERDITDIQLPESLVEPKSEPSEKKIFESMDVSSGNTPNRKRRAAIEQSNIMKKIIKQKQ